MTAFGRLNAHFINEIINAGGVVNCTRMPKMHHEMHDSHRLSEVWKAQVHRLHVYGRDGVTKPREFNADVCDPMLACDFFNFYVTSNDYERFLLMTTYLQTLGSASLLSYRLADS